MDRYCVADLQFFFWCHSSDANVACRGNARALDICGLEEYRGSVNCRDIESPCASMYKIRPCVRAAISAEKAQTVVGIGAITDQIDVRILVGCLSLAELDKT